MLIFWHSTENLKIDHSRILITFSIFVTSASALEHSLHFIFKISKSEKFGRERKIHGLMQWRTDKLIVPFLNRNIHNKIEMHIYTHSCLLVGLWPYLIGTQEVCLQYSSLPNKLPNICQRTTMLNLCTKFQTINRCVSHKVTK